MDTQHKIIDLIRNNPQDKDNLTLEKYWPIVESDTVDQLYNMQIKIDNIVIWKVKEIIARETKNKINLHTE